MPLPLPPAWQPLLTPAPAAAPVRGQSPEKALWTAIEKGDTSGVSALLESGVNAETVGVLEGVTRPVLEFAVGVGHFDIATLLADHGARLSVAAIIRHKALAKAAFANHVPFARHLVSWGAHPHLQDGETGSGVEWWNPHLWMEKSPDFVRWWVESNAVDFGADPGRPDACFSVQRGWLSFLSLHHLPDLADRVMDVFRGQEGSRLRRNWDRALSGAWKNGVETNATDRLTGLLGLGLVPALPLVGPGGKPLPALLGIAIEAGHFPMARWLAQSPAMVAELRRTWPDSGMFSTVLRLPPDFRQWVLTLPLDWTASNPEGNTVLHVLFDEIELLAPEVEDDLPDFDDEDDEEEYEQEIQRHYGSFADQRVEELSTVCPASMLDQENGQGWKPLSLHPLMDDLQREQACARYRIILEKAGLQRNLEVAPPASRSTPRL